MSKNSTIITASINRAPYVGLAVISLTTLMYEILLTRIFSVTMWYHFAFMAISIAMFGMTAGAMLVYLLPSLRKSKNVNHQLAINALLMALTILFSLAIQLTIPFTTTFSLFSLLKLITVYLISALPFTFSGICICLALTKFPKQLAKLYAADLLGAALGCILIIIILSYIDAPSAVMACAVIAACGAMLFNVKNNTFGLRKTIFISGSALLLLMISNITLNALDLPHIRTVWNKTGIEYPTLFEKWNSFSRISVYGVPQTPSPPFFWGMSPAFQQKHLYRSLFMTIDASAGTPLTYYQGDPNIVDYLKYDITNFVHYVRPNSNVLVIGVGGGRDILSALLFKQKTVTGIEINKNILNILTHTFADYTGHLNKDPRVKLINDEARSHIAQMSDHFDIIQLSLIDTWAATAAGAFALTENSLYTVEAWTNFLSHLTSDGIFMVSRWYTPEQPAQLYRLTTLACAALAKIGVSDPRNHIAIIAVYPPPSPGSQTDITSGIATLLVSKDGFSSQQLSRITQTARQLQFKILLTSETTSDPNLVKLTIPTKAAGFIQHFPFNIAAPTDNNPYFFQMLKFKRMFDESNKINFYNFLTRQNFSMVFDSINANDSAIFTLTFLLIIVIILTLLCFILPLFFISTATDRAMLRTAKPLLFYFSCIGLGFMLIEISQMQRLIIFLGHPIYSLAVVLFTLLLATGIGSFLTAHFNSFIRAISLWLLLGLLILFAVITPTVLEQLQAMSNALRIATAIGCLFPLGLLMGSAFPLGMQLAQTKTPALTPWLWSINGATSVCASVLAIIIAISVSVTAAFWAGVVCYFLAALAYSSSKNTSHML
jgi:hypothetical protein